MITGLELITLGLIAQIVLQFIVALVAYKIYKLINHGNIWGFLLFISFVLMGAHRITALLNCKFSASLVLLDKLFLPLSITLFLFFGIRGMQSAVERENSAKLQAQDNLKHLREKMNLDND